MTKTTGVPASGSSRSPRRSLRYDSATVTMVLTGVIAVAAVVMFVATPRQPLLSPPEGYVAGAGMLALVAAFFLTELGQALIEFRQQAYSFSLAGIPMVLGLLYCPPQDLMLARLAAVTVAFLLQRPSPMKFAFNAASYLLDTALVVGLTHQLIGDTGALNLHTAMLCYAGLAGVDLVMTGLVLLVIRINDGRVSRPEAAQVLLPTTAFVVLNTALGFICAILLNAGSLGGMLLLLFVGVTAGVYRGYLVLRRRHQSLEVIQKFIEDSEGAGTVHELAGRLLGDICTLVRASRVELTLRDEKGDIELCVISDGQPHAVAHSGRGRRTSDRAYSDGLAGEAAVISAKSSDPSHAVWLREHGVTEAAVVPMTRAGTHGSLVAIDRLGEATSFTRDDLALLQAFAGHLTVALRNTELVARLRHDATHDALTGLPNRSLLTARLVEALAVGEGAGRPSVLLLDLNRFKEVNDALGHHVGDQLLQVVAARLERLQAAGAIVARLGGDEFAVLLPAGDQAAALDLARRIAETLRTSVDLPDVTVSTEASIGVAIARPGETHADLLRHADTAMYAAKASGSAYMIYTADLDAGRSERLALLADLTLALERDELQVYYQPKLDLAFDLVTSVEALVRWTHPTLGPLAPDVFIPLAESTGLIDHLTDIVLAKALSQCRVWQDAGLDLAVAVNLSARNVLDPALPDHIAAALVSAGLPAQKLILEITESSIMGDPDRTVPTLERLAAIGVTLSLDDFGTGYSSLSYLQRLPVREVKIDRSFVMGLTREGEKAASEILVRAIIGLGTSLGLRIVAEGVESAEVLNQLRDLGCDIIQGYHVGRPVPGHELTATLGAAGRRTLKGPAYAHHV